MITAIVLLLVTSLTVVSTIGRTGKRLILVFGVLPILLTPWWIQHAPHGVFGWAKIYSVCFAAAGIGLIQYKHIGTLRFRTLFAPVAFGVNILEVAFLAMSRGGDREMVVAAMSVILVLLLAKPSATPEKVRGIEYNLGQPWIDAYTVWNLMIVYALKPGHIFMHATILFAAHYLAFRRPSEWAAIRAVTLGTFLMMFFTYKPAFDQMRPEDVTRPEIFWTLAGVSALLFVRATVDRFRNKDFLWSARVA